MAKTRIGSNAIFTGPQKGLTIVDEWAYAYNQVGTAQLQTPTNTLDFTTGKYIFVGNWIVSGSANKDGVSGTGGVDQFYLKFNGTAIMSIKVDSGEEDMQSYAVVPIVIPPLTHIEALADCTVNNDNWLVSNTLTGRIYK